MNQHSAIMRDFFEFLIGEKKKRSYFTVKSKIRQSGKLYMIKYCVVKEKLFHPDIGEYVSYGMLCCSVLADETRVIEFISDVSCDEKFVTELAEKFTVRELSPLHFLSAVEDALE